MCCLKNLKHWIFKQSTLSKQGIRNLMTEVEVPSVVCCDVLLACSKTMQFPWHLSHPPRKIDVEFYDSGAVEFHGNAFSNIRRDIIQFLGYMITEFRTSYVLTNNYMIIALSTIKEYLQYAINDEISFPTYMFYLDIGNVHVVW